MVLLSVVAACTLSGLWNCVRWVPANGILEGQFMWCYQGLCRSAVGDDLELRPAWRAVSEGECGVGQSVSKLGHECWQCTVSHRCPCV